MKAVLFLLSALALPLLAAPPKEPQRERYTRLWKESPFTEKALPAPAPTAVDPFKGYSLGGVSKLKDGYFVVVLNEQDPGKKILIGPGVSSGFDVLSVNWSDTHWQDTTVRVKQGTKTGTLSFDPVQLRIAGSTVGALPSNNSGALQNSNRDQDRQRRPRPRVSTPR